MNVFSLLSRLIVTIIIPVAASLIVVELFDAPASICFILTFVVAWVYFFGIRKR